MGDTPNWPRSRAGRTLPRDPAYLVGSLPLPLGFGLSLVATSAWGSFLCWIAYMITTLATW
ncbi:hypothetical protein GCM10007887_38120 [Methylobacterium haplocladii]|nr:hypothetical protein GCM10007887_38120 [Methylobacterium haplocladii]